MSIVAYEVLKNYKKSNVTLPEPDSNKDFEYMLLEDDKNIELYEYKEEIGIRDI
jgi:hypothetical protein